MLLDYKISIRVTISNKEYYESLGYEVNGKYINVDSKHLTYGSQNKVPVKCDNIDCQKEGFIIYAKYIKNLNRNKGMYCCNKCSINSNFKINNPKYDKLSLEKAKETCIKNYGVDNPSKSDIIKMKKIETCRNNYGVDNPIKSDEIKSKIKNTNRERYGSDYVSSNEEIKQKVKDTCIERYGVCNPSQIDAVKTKKVETCRKNHGVDSPAQSSEIYNKMVKSSLKVKMYKNTSLTYQSTYEKKFLDYCENKGYLDLISNGPSLKYIYSLDNEEHTYYSDFYIEKFNLIIEIKSLYIYMEDIDKNIDKKHYSELEGYDFLFIFDKDHDEFESIMSIR